MHNIFCQCFISDFHDALKNECKLLTSQHLESFQMAFRVFYKLSSYIFYKFPYASAKIFTKILIVETFSKYLILSQNFGKISVLKKHWRSVALLYRGDQKSLAYFAQYFHVREQGGSRIPQGEEPPGAIHSDGQNYGN